MKNQQSGEYCHGGNSPIQEQTNRLFDGGCHTKHINKPPMLYKAESLKGVECFVRRKWKEENPPTPPLLTLGITELDSWIIIEMSTTCFWLLLYTVTINDLSVFIILLYLYHLTYHETAIKRATNQVYFIYSPLVMLQNQVCNQVRLALDVTCLLICRKASLRARSSGRSIGKGGTNTTYFTNTHTKITLRQVEGAWRPWHQFLVILPTATDPEASCSFKLHIPSPNGVGTRRIFLELRSDALGRAQANLAKLLWAKALLLKRAFFC